MPTYTQQEVLFILSNRFPNYFVNLQWLQRKVKGSKSGTNKYGNSYSKPPSLIRGEDYTECRKVISYTHKGLRKLIAIRELEIERLSKRNNKTGN